MEKNRIMEKDERLERIQEQLIKFTQFDFTGRIPVSDKADDIDAIIVGLNTLGEELELKSPQLHQQEKRINELSEVLLKYTLMDFSQQIPISDEGDELDAIAVGLNTLSEELQSNIRQLKEYQYFFNKSHDLSCIANVQGYFEILNPNFEKVLGYSEKELLENQFLNFTHPDDIASTLQEIEKLKAGAVAINFVNRYRKKDGTYLWFEWNSTPNPATGKLYAIARDITERKKAEEQLLAVNKELESFTYSVSHDLRAPLRAIDGFANIIHEDYINALDEEGRRLLGVIRFNAKKMGNLIDDLLSFSRLGRKEIQKTNVNMKVLAESATIELNKVSEHHAEVRIGDLHAAPADYTLIYQVLLNLISNAVKYSSKVKTPLVDITSEQKKGEVIYSVKDNGAGFDMQYVHKLFGVFQRLHRQEEFEGTGVGLAIVQRIINKHGGKVWAEAALGKGATFNFSLPIN